MSSVLIVEDDTTLALLLRDVCHICGYEPIIVHSAYAAAVQLAQARPLLMTLDLRMPGINGQTLLQVVRAQPETADLPVIVITAQPITHQIRALADAVLPKPFDLDELVETIQRSVDAAGLTHSALTA